MPAIGVMSFKAQPREEASPKSHNQLLFAEVKQMHDAGRSMKGIAYALGMNRRTVRK